MNDKIKLIYVDDEEMNLMLFNLNFNKKYEVITAESGVSGLHLLEEHLDTEIVISDMKMPIMNGLEFVQKAKSKYPNIKFYILTGFDISDEIREALDSRLVLKYFKKPFNFNEIDDAIRMALKN